MRIKEKSSLSFSDILDRKAVGASWDLMEKEKVVTIRVKQETK